MEAPKLNIFFLPFYTTSHILPMVDTARLFAANGVISHIVTTHHNSLLFENIINQDINQHGRHSQIIIHKLNFPSKEVDLPEGVENYNSATSSEMNKKVFMAVMLLRTPMEQLLRDSRPDCIVSDMFFPWTVDVANDLGIPRIHFNPTGVFPRSVSHNVKTYAPHEKVESEAEFFFIPGLPDSIYMKRSQLSEEALKTKTGYALIREKMEEAETKSYGTIINSFLDLEPTYIHYFKEVNKGLKFWTIGPISLFCSKLIRNVITDSNKNDQYYDLFNWLDSQKPNSVLYVCFGSMVRFSIEQLREIAMGLEASGKPFLWVCRPPLNSGSEWLPEGFEERVKKGKLGWLIKGWAPQVLILDHPSIAGFMSQCGWYALMETVLAGFPLITWPLFAEHFYNEKLIVNVLKIGIEVGSEYWNEEYFIKTPIVEKEKIVKAICRFMNGNSEEVEEMRRRVKELKRMANTAVEDGGSSCSDLMALISELKSRGKVKDGF